MKRKVAVIGIPYDEQSSYLRGCAGGPSAIRQAWLCDSSNTYCEAGFDLKNHPSVLDQGDLNFSTEPENGAKIRQQIESAVETLAKDKHQVLSLGGDHAITWPVLRGLHRVHGPLNVLHLDAHPDLYDELDGNRYSHATPMARSLEDKLIHRLVQVGIRTMNAHQQAQADRFDVEVIAMKDWRDGMKFPLEDFEGPTYLSIDLDVLDPAFAPGVSHHEPGGFSTRQLIRIIQDLNVELVGADIIELNPSRDLNNMTAMVAAKLFKELLAKMLESATD